MKDTESQVWPTYTLGEVALIVNGGTPKSKVADYWGGDVQWLTPKDMGQMEGREIGDTPRTISESGLSNSSARLVPEQSVILSTRAPIGHLAVNNVPMAFNQGCRGIVPSDNLDRLFLYYFLLANRSLLEALGTGTTFKELSSTNLKSVRIPLPPLEDQRRIVAVLDKAFAGLARAHANAEANLADATNILSRSLDVWMDEIAARNGHVRIGEIAAVKGGKRLPKGEKTVQAPTGFPYISVRDFTDNGSVSMEKIGYISEEVQKGIARYTISSRDVFVSIAGTIGKSGIVPKELDGANLTENAAKLVPVSGWLNQFIYWCTQSSDFSEQVVEQTRVAAQPKLALQRLGSITIPRALEHEQADLVQRMDALRKLQERTTSAHESKLQNLDDLRQSLLQVAFSGGLS